MRRGPALVRDSDYSKPEAEVPEGRLLTAHEMRRLIDHAGTLLPEDDQWLSAGLRLEPSPSSFSLDLLLTRSGPTRRGSAVMSEEVEDGSTGLRPATITTRWG